MQVPQNADVGLQGELLDMIRVADYNDACCKFITICEFVSAATCCTMS